MIDQYFFELRDGTKFTYEFNDYVPENERYGGNETIAIAERQFNKSSRTIINLIQSNYNVWSYGMAMSFAIQMHLCLSRLLFSKKDEILFYKRFYKDWLLYARGIDGTVENVKIPEVNNVIASFESSFEKQKSNVETLIEFINSDQEDGWQTQWKKDCSEIASLYDAHQLNDKYLVYSSLIHMTNNRLGIHISDESFIAFLIFKGLERKFLDVE